MRFFVSNGTYLRALFALSGIAVPFAIAASSQGCDNLISLPNSGTDAANGDDAQQGAGDDVAPGDDGGQFDGNTGLVDCTGEDASFGPPNDLACTGLYSDFPSKTLSPAVQAYDPVLSFWNDGATKKRWVYIPSGSKIDTSDMNEWTFPIGFKAWQEIAVSGHRVETRMFWKRGTDDWVRTTYAWSSDESSSVSLTTGQDNVGGSSYSIPSVAECDECHEGRVDRILGFEAVSLAQAGATLSLAQLQTMGLLTNAPPTTLTIPDDGTGRGAKALGWLHVNCGTSCHNASNSSFDGISGLNLRLDIHANSLGTIQTTNTYVTSVNQRALYQDNAPTGGTCPGGGWCRIIPGDVTDSLIPFRDSRRNDPQVQMPPIDTNVPDITGSGYVSDWIANGTFSATP